jgi:hypothetical protein
MRRLFPSGISVPKRATVKIFVRAGKNNEMQHIQKRGGESFIPREFASSLCMYGWAQVKKDASMQRMSRKRVPYSAEALMFWMNRRSEYGYASTLPIPVRVRIP